jgi:hypothetical protein
MPGWFGQDPAWVSEILHWQWVFFAARLALTSAYLLGGLTKLFNFSAAIKEQEHFGFHPGWLWARRFSAGLVGLYGLAGCRCIGVPHSGRHALGRQFLDKVGRGASDAGKHLL